MVFGDAIADGAERYAAERPWWEWRGAAPMRTWGRGADNSKDMGVACSPWDRFLHPLEDPRDPLKTQYNPLNNYLGLPRDFGLRDLWLSET